MKNPLTIRIEELIENTSDEQFYQIYEDYRNYRKKHFVEYGVMKCIAPLVEELSDVMEEQRIFRTKMKKKSIQFVKPEIEKEIVETIKEEPEPVVVKNNPEPWEVWWKQQQSHQSQQPSQSSEKPLSFGKIFSYVVGVHICIISFVSLNSWMNSSPAPQKIEQKAAAPVAPGMPKYVAGPLSDALSRR